MEAITESDVDQALPRSEPGSVNTRPFMLPRQDTAVIKTEIIEVYLTPGQMEESFRVDEERELPISFERLPTKVITKTITIEGDSADMAPEEIERLLREAPEECTDFENVISTEVVRSTIVHKTITGKTFTITGDGDDEEIQRMVGEAVPCETPRTVDEDGNVIITAVRDEVVESTSLLHCMREESDI